MNNAFCFLLFAQQAAKQPKPGDWAFGWPTIALIAAGASAIVLIAWLVSRVLAVREQKTKNSPWCLLKELAEAHGLNHRERQLVTRLAKHLQLSQPAALFVEPSWWELERLGSSWSSCRSELERLRKRLFAVR